MNISPNGAMQPDRTVFEEPPIVQALEGLTDGFSTFDENWCFTFVSPRCKQLYNLPPDVIGKHLWRDFSLLVGTKFHAEALRALAEQKTITVEEECPYTRLWIESRIQPCRNGVTVYYQDLSERLKARSEQSRLVSILEATTDFVSIFDTKGKPPFINRAGRQMLGIGEDEDISQINILLHPTWASDLVLREGIPTAMREGVWKGETALLTRDGTEIPVSQVLIAHKNASDEVEFISTIARDIAESKRAEMLLHEQAALLDQAPDAIVVCDLNRAIKFWYLGAERMYGWKAEEARGKVFCDLLAGERCNANLREYIDEFFRTGEWRGELRFRTKAGREIVNDCHWTLVRDEAGHDQSILIIHTDITEKKKLEEQFLRTQRMESIGTLAGGIAHDLNNVLSPILLATRILSLKFTDDDSQKLLDTLRRSAERGADLVRQVLTYARGTDGERVLLQPQHLIREVVRMLQDTLPKSILVRQQLPAQLWATTGDTTQLYQVVTNLCVNARDAMPEGGTLTITAANVSLSANAHKTLPDAYPGDFIVIRVQDTGHGIPGEIRSKIFEPFFTTKVAGQGSGLGLATVLGIVHSHYGFIDFESELGQGTSFEVYLPAVKNKVAPEFEREVKDLPRGKGQTILIVDDEVEILKMTSETLIAYGYHTLTANGGDDALQQCRQNPKHIDLALVDMMMPKMDGLMTIQELKKLSPKLKIITTSGLTDSKKQAAATALGAQAFLDKPCPPGKMIQTIAAVLNSNS
ncbi:MAG TPA: PAS domain S-box protein [Blastocatellia bacterium]|nr:PAS domain S-box protein [Blastocatellia bacterium]